MMWVAVAGSQDRRLWKDGNSWISILAVGGAGRKCGAFSDSGSASALDCLLGVALSS